MSELLKKIRDDLRSAMWIDVEHRKDGTHSEEIYETAISQKTVSRSILSMFPEIHKKPADATDDDVIKLLKKYIGQEKERAIYQLGHLKEKDVEGKTHPEVKKLVSATITALGHELFTRETVIAEMYLPKQAGEEEIVAWIEKNLDLSSYKNKMQAMGPIMKQFKGCDGNFVKGILMNFQSSLVTPDINELLDS